MTGDCGCPGPAGNQSKPSNRPGLSSLAYRLGTHTGFLDAMIARLGAMQAAQSAAPTTRDPGDPAIALLDAWAVVADVLTFYQERIANEGYLRTATEDRSLKELASLVGYVPRPGVAASLPVAYTVQDQGGDANVDIPAGSKVQSLPVAGELPKVFETAAPGLARASWSQLGVRTARAQQVSADSTAVFLNGTSTKLKPNDPLLIVDGKSRTLRRIATVDIDTPRQRITLGLQLLPSKVEPGGRTASLASGDVPLAQPDAPSTAPAAPDASFATSVTGVSPLQDPAFTRALSLPPAQHPVNALDLHQNASERLKPDTDAGPQLLTRLDPALQGSLRTALRNTTVAPPSAVQVFAFNVRTAPFGSTAPLRNVVVPANGHSPATTAQQEWTFEVPAGSSARLVEASRTRPAEAPPTVPLAFESPGILYLDSSYPNVVAPSWAFVRGVDATGAPRDPVISQITEVHGMARADYGLSAKTTRLMLDTPWFDPTNNGDFTEVVRGTEVYVQSEALDLADAPITLSVDGASIELDDLHDGLAPGRWLIVTGERLDIPDTKGVSGTEVVMLKSASHAVETIGDDARTLPGGRAGSVGVGAGTPAPTPTPGPAARDDSSLLPGGRMRTTLTLSSALSYRYVRDSVRIYGNVINATHGETHAEILGSGDGKSAFRSFALRYAPLTYVSAATPSGVASTLQVRVNGVAWAEVKSFNGAGPDDRVFVTRQLADGTTQVTFGNGTQGATLPPGVENVRATYRSGIGVGGNANAGQVTQLATRPLGVMGVVNPVAAAGGADPESGADIRRHAPQGLASLDRLVSIADYEDFGRTFAGVGKASAVQLSADNTRLVHVTLAAANDAPLTAASALLVNLAAAIARFGDPYVRVRLQPREALLLVISARVKVAPAYEWTRVAPLISAALLDAFGFARRDLGQDVALSEVLAVMQNVAGVDYVDVDVFDRIAEAGALGELERIAYAREPSLHRMIVARMARRDNTAQGAAAVLPAQIAYLSADIPATLTLTEITS
ncbi:putative baseplate assembly protein [Caballeronia sp. SEWSISQ10-4 2]|uniref:putative baseplate assembly protein n=1 Tax=Caballeronia sp. SEWSISQ10-4 2 TaxID=2937438 RepID=UPI0026525AAD|nr:putative baseplate assembly protein [Caballeronia sp. SEWSISQ10-4 2]MDN7179633.1 putative baseplate assembly protein [Caballeronia sp. SEWSISQ10-4 2]